VLILEEMDETLEMLVALDDVDTGLTVSLKLLVILAEVEATVGFLKLLVELEDDFELLELFDIATDLTVEVGTLVLRVTVLLFGEVASLTLEEETLMLDVSMCELEEETLVLDVSLCELEEATLVLDVSLCELEEATLVLNVSLCELEEETLVLGVSL
jgi:hypothetical protein